MSEKKFVSTSKACKVFGLTHETLKEQAAAGKIESYKTNGGHWRFNIGKKDSYDQINELITAIKELTAAIKQGNSHA